MFKFFVGMIIFVGVGMMLYFFIITSFSTSKMEQMNLELQKISYLQKLQFDVSTIQQFLTDYSLTGEEDSKKEAHDGYLSFKKNVHELVKLDPKIDEQKMNNEIEDLYNVGIEMANQYLNVGKYAGDKMMEKFDGASATIISEMDNLKKKYDSKKYLDSNEKLMLTSKIVLLILGVLTFLMVLWVVNNMFTKLFFQMASLTNEIEDVAKSVALGNFHLKVNEQKYDEEFTQIAKNSNGILESFIKILKSLPFSFATMDKDLNLLFANEKFIELSESKDYKNAVNRSCSSFVKTEQCNNSCATALAIKTGKEQRKINKLLLNGKEIIFQQSSYPIVYEGEVVGATELVIDQTDMIKASNKSKEDVKYLKNEFEKISTFLETINSGSFNVEYINESYEDKDIEKIFIDMRQKLYEFKDGLFNIVKDLKDNSKNIDKVSNKIGDVIEVLNEKVAEVMQQSENNIEITNDLNGNSSTTAAVVEEISINSGNVASGLTEIKEMFNELSQSMEEMVNSIKDIAKNTNEAQELSVKSIDTVEQTSNRMKNLGESAKQIGNVTDMIKRIAEQTNLLALNATIEAASAGEAGKGFAVVANEIKELANQSAKAAEDIASQIQSVQDNVSEAIQNTESVSTITSNIGEIINLIDKSILKQDSTTDSINSNFIQNISKLEVAVNQVAEISEGIQEINQTIAQVSSGTNMIVENLNSEVSAIEEVNNISGNMNNQKDELKGVVVNINSSISKFEV